MALMSGDGVSFLSSFTPKVRWSILLMDFLSIDLQDELFSLGRQGEAGGLGSVDHNQPLFGHFSDEVHSVLHPDGCCGYLLCFGP